MRIRKLSGISSRFRELSRSYRQVAHVLLTRPPLVPQVSSPKRINLLPALDLHVLGTPPAFVLSQDQTLNKIKEVDFARLKASILLIFLTRCLIQFSMIKHLMVGLSGLEPPTSRLSGVRSNQLSYRPIMILERVKGIEPSTTAWKAVVLPLNYTRIYYI